MVAGQTDLRRFLAHDDVTAVAALPHLDLALGEDLRHLHIVQQGTVALLVVLLDGSHQTEPLGQLMEAKVKDAGVPVICCGEPMSEIIPGTTDAAVEKHVPVWTVENGIVHVKVGSVEHPMLPEHYIEWVSLHTKQGNQRKELHPGEKPEVCFALCEGDEVEAVYAYCNLHSLWKA